MLHFLLRNSWLFFISFLNWSNSALSSCSLLRDLYLIVLWLEGEFWRICCPGPFKKIGVGGRDLNNISVLVFSFVLFVFHLEHTLIRDHNLPIIGLWVCLVGSALDSMSILHAVTCRPIHSLLLKQMLCSCCSADDSAGVRFLRKNYTVLGALEISWGSIYASILIFF